MPTIDPYELDKLGDGVEKVKDAAQEMTLVEIYDKICTDEDIIIVIDAVDEPRVRKGLSSIKAKRNAKLRDSNLPTDDAQLEFVRHEDKDIPKERVKLQIFMRKKPTVTIHSLQVADGEL